MKKRAALIVIACILVSGALCLSLPYYPARSQSVYHTIKHGRHACFQRGCWLKTELLIGKASAPITIIEYGDYKCPKCNELHQKAGKDIRRDWVDTGKAKII